MRRELWEALAEWFEAAQPISAGSDWLRVSSFELDLPIEVSMRLSSHADGGYAVLADAPRWRAPSGFETPPSRLQLRLVSVPIAGNATGGVL